MCAKRNRESEMSGADQARTWANDLVKRESRGPGDMENSMRRLETKYGIPWRTFWELRYRPPKDVMHGVWERLRQAHLAECDRQMRLMQHEIELTKATKPEAHSVASAQAYVDEVME
jgi:hypothetical protein